MTAPQAKDTSETLRELVEAINSGSELDLSSALAELHPADIASLLESIPPDRRLAVWTLVDPEDIGEVLVELSEGVRDDLVAVLDNQQLVAAVHKLDADDMADLLPELPDETVAQIMFAMDRETRQRLDAVLSYPEDTAGGLMNVDFVMVRENISVEGVLRYLRMRGDLPEYTNRLFVVDRQNRLAGGVLITRLLTTDVHQRIGEIMETDLVKFTALTPDTKVADAFERYNIVTAPVVDDGGRLIGRITIDDVVDVIREQADHSVLARAGLKEEEDIFAPVAESTKNRAVWLGVNLVTAFIASWVIGQFEGTISKLVALAVLMPIVASMGGNAGTQTLTVVIRGIAVGTITAANAKRVLRKELMVGGLNGLIWAVVVAAVATLWFKDYALGLIIAAAMIINLVFSALAGVLLPMLFRRLGIDPALAGGVALTTITDVVGFLAFLGLAALFLV
jgi:magnesium transporter